MSANLSPSKSLPLAVVALLAVVVGPLGAMLGLFPPMLGFINFLVGGAVGLAALIWGAVAKRRGRTRGGALAALVGAVAFLVVAVPSVLAMTKGHPRINDITTDRANPPAFLQSTDHGDYPKDFADVAAEAYPGVKSLELSVPSSRALAHALDVARDRDGWEIVATTDGGFEAYELTTLFKFRDDFVVRVTGSGSGSILDMRSASRDGQGDFGVNAARIESFLAAVAERAK